MRETENVKKHRTVRAMSPETRNPALKAAAQDLRRNMTKEERRLWYDFLKALPVNVHRQKVIGSYIVDFYIAQAKLVIELDGSQHFESERRQMDIARDQYLAARGLVVLRYSNREIHESFQVVCQDIWRHVFPEETPHPSQPSAATPSPKGEGD